MRKSKVTINDDKLQDSSEVLRALAHPLRMKILEFIDKHKTINVNKIYNSMKLEQSITSQHLKILRSTEIVLTERDGKFIHYSVNYSKLTSVLKAVDTFHKDWESCITDDLCDTSNRKKQKAITIIVIAFF